MKTAIRCGIKNTSEIGAEIGLLQRCKKVLQRCKKVRIYLQLSHAPTSMLFLLRDARAHFTAALHGLWPAAALHGLWPAAALHGHWTHITDPLSSSMLSTP
jgi:hypothetical protein